MNSDLAAVALSVRSLSMDAIQRANSGHPGLPLGAAELAAVLYGKLLRHNPANPLWADRDRFVLSAGHGSMFLYSILHLSGYEVSLDDIRSFRQPGSRCPGHPEYGYTPGVETTTGPLGQGVAMAVGMAIAETMLAARFNTAEFQLVNHYTYALVGEGCLMEGVASEAVSLAGHLKLGKLIVFYDENRISIDGSVDLAFSEDVAARHEACGWQVLRGSMYDMDAIQSLVEQAKADHRPSLVMLKSVIGKGAPSVEDSHKAHGAPLGAEGLAAAKKHLGLDPACEFAVPQEAYDWFGKRRTELAAQEAAWNTLFAKWSAAHPELRTAWDALHSSVMPGEAALAALSWPSYTPAASLATRAASQDVLNVCASALPAFVGGSADLQGPNAVAMKGEQPYQAENRTGRYLHFGIREFAMAAVTNGIQLHGGFRAFCATFLVFSDYLRPALRLAAIMKLPVIHVFSHDSIFVGEDGPTHQPIETLESLRLIPNLLVLRPADAEETVQAWRQALSHGDGPVCIILSRQNLPVLAKDDPDWRHTVECGAYIVRKGADVPDCTVLASGSEVSLALQAAALVAEKTVRVVSVLCRERLEAQPALVRAALIGASAGAAGPRIITAEAGVAGGWKNWASDSSAVLSIDRFGESGPGPAVAAHLGFTAEALAEMIREAP